MKPNVKIALLGDLILRLRAAGNWCGETHVQKSVYFLQTACQAAMGYAFVLYKHGPYSFDLDLDISRLLGRRMLQQQPSPPPYGPRLNTTASMKRHVNRHLADIADYSTDSARIVQFVGRRGVADLERLSTALYVTVTHRAEPMATRAERINKLKPHVSVEMALEAVKELDTSSILDIISDPHRETG